MVDGSALVLVADDDPVTRLLLSTLVQREGHRSMQAENGQAACEILASEPIDIVLLDIEMPEVDGYGVLARIQEQPQLRGVPVIMVSSLDDIANVVHAIELGADDYLPKPVNRTLLRARINACLERRRLLQLEREHVRSLFSRFVPEPVVDQVLSNVDDNLRLGGERLVATVMFCDLRRFTSWAEAHSPDDVINVLNHYLSTVSDIIMDCGGTLVSYMGDGIMAVFGAPLAHSSHADLAVEAARAIAVHALADFNSWLRGQELGAGFRMGIGLASGPVMSGNVGSERRLEYTAVGDTTNTAARLEQLTKGSGHMVLLSGTTRAMLERDQGDLARVGEVTLRGKQQAVEVWALSLADYADTNGL
ncbi:adenylate/guanylate cyclase domain-containing protein [Streptomyces sp. NPDC008343]|uniref:adenylate/guanylate cyclase domain-containing protein n=1 Tax=Streptomyces sp. NPDC008343 TaxID=3364828 RepID=UPI0036E027C1